MSHPFIEPYQKVFEKYDPALDTCIDESDMSAALAVFMVDVVSHGNTVLLNDLFEKLDKNPSMKGVHIYWSSSATMLATLEHKSDVLMYLMENVTTNYDRNSGALQLLKNLTFKEDLSHFDRIFQSISDKKYNLSTNSVLGTATFVYNLIARNEKQRLERVCNTYPSLLENAEILNQSGVYACYFNSADTLNYLLQKPYEVNNWTLWLMGAADSFSLDPNTDCAFALLDAVPEDKKTDFFIQFIERLEVSGKDVYLPFLHVVAPSMLQLPLADQSKIVSRIKKHSTQGVFVQTCVDMLESHRLKDEITKHVTQISPSRTKKI